MLSKEILLGKEIFKKFRSIEVCNLFWCVLRREGGGRKYYLNKWVVVPFCKSSENRKR